MLMGADGPEHLIGRRVAQSLECLECGYDLNGAEAMGRCPECGMPVPFSLAGSIDPIVHKLSPIPNPRAVGRGLVAATVVMAVLSTAVFMWTLFWVAAALQRDGVFDSLKTFGTERFQTPWWILSVLLMVLGGFSLWSFRPQRRGRVPVGTTRSLLLFASGILLAGVGAAAIPFTGGRSAPGTWLLAASPLMTVPGQAVMLIGFRGILIEVGQRCITFRQAKVRRQRIPPLLAAIGLFVVAWSGLLGALWTKNEPVTVMALAVGLMAMLFTGVGCWYLLLNAWWISSALHTPPERLRALLTDPT
jgi:hypothetical protein